ncbi:Protocadherin beta-18 [Merluccius polli]|uniref:Protocadherin beta-18 n=1 Tax=Merluccius polli TaxID=89951 RepID=A0AA47MQW9_MERPO|nr:Protocadherin beta-18 [Merluccius polli]
MELNERKAIIAYYAVGFLLLLLSNASAQIRYSITEEVKQGTVVGNIAKDLGLDTNSLKERGCRVVAGSTESLFQVNQHDGLLYVKEIIDREDVCERTSPCLINLKTVLENPLEIHYVVVEVLDVNDHSPSFSEKEARLDISESGLPGLRIQLQAARDPDVVKASDPDENTNSLISYNIPRAEREDNKHSSLLNINPESGVIVALKSFDFETLKTFQFHVVATDAGTISRNSNVTVNVFILDDNDNAPVIMYPLNANGSAEGVEEIPRNVNAGHLVTKVRAYDADIGYNGWLLFSLLEVTDHSLFGLDRYTGQIRTLRSFTETDGAQHKLVILVKDNGNVSLSATATVVVKLVEPKEAIAASDVKSVLKADDESNVTFYLMITLGSVSALFIASIIVLVVMQCSKPRELACRQVFTRNKL